MIKRAVYAREMTDVNCEELLEAMKISSAIDLLRELTWVRHMTVENTDCEDRGQEVRERSSNFHEALAVLIANHTPMERRCMSDN